MTMLTEKQKERIKNKILQIKKGLAADKKHWGGYYHDGSGLRYLPPALYIQIEDYTSGLRYLNWFDKNFDQDGGYPIFWLEWAIIFFKRNRLKKAEQQVFEIYCQNTFLLDKFLGKPLKNIAIAEHNWLGSLAAIEKLRYSHRQPHLEDFSIWLNDFIESDKFIVAANRFVALNTQLNNEREVKKRGKLLNQIGALKSNFLKD